MSLSFPFHFTFSFSCFPCLPFPLPFVHWPRARLGASPAYYGKGYHFLSCEVHIPFLVSKFFAVSLFPKEEFVELVSKFKLCESTAKEVEAFKRGFHLVSFILRWYFFYPHSIFCSLPLSFNYELFAIS